MPIKVACQCGASFAAKDELAGKAVRCPKCKNPLKIPAPAAPVAPQPNAMDDLFDEVGIERKTGPTCPHCHAELKTNALVCVACGVNLQTGERTVGAEAAGGAAGTTEMILQKAQRQIVSDKEEDKKNRTHGAPFYVYLFGLIMIITFATLMFVFKDNRGMAFAISGNAVICFAILRIVYYNIRIVIVAFYDSIAQGLLYLFVPLYFLVYWIMRWNNVRQFATPLIVTMFVGGSIGGVMIFLGFVIPPAKKENDYSAVPKPAEVVLHDTEFREWIV